MRDLSLVDQWAAGHFRLTCPTLSLHERTSFFASLENEVYFKPPSAFAVIDVYVKNVEKVDVNINSKRFPLWWGHPTEELVSLPLFYPLFIDAEYDFVFPKISGPADLKQIVILGGFLIRTIA